MDEVRAVISFGDIFWPTFSALILSSVLFEALHFGLTFWAQRNQQKKMKEMEDLLAQGIVPEGMNGQMIFDLPPNMYGGSPFPSTVSGQAETKDHQGHGQYL